MCCLSERYKILYSRPSKTGGGAVELSLGGYNRLNPSNSAVKRIGPNKCHGLITNEILNAYFDFNKIVTIRNTFSRTVSLYRWIYKNKLNTIITPEMSKISNHKYVTFKEFVTNKNIYNQHKYLNYFDTKQKVLKPISDIIILRYENLENDFNCLMKAIDPTCKLVKKEKKPMLHYYGEYNYKDYYDESSKAIVCELAVNDIMSFGCTYE